MPRSGTGAAGCRLPTKPLFSQLSGWVESSRSAQEVVCFQAIGSFGSRDEIPYLESDQTLDPVQPEFLAPRLLKWLNSLYRPALPEGIRGRLVPPLSRQLNGASPSGKAVDFDSTMRRFESSRPSQDLANKIRHFLNLPDFHSERRSLPNSEGLFPMRSPAHGRTAFWSLIGRGANSSWHSPRMIPSSGAPIGRGLGRTRDVDSCDDKRKRRSGWTSSAKIE